MVEFIDEIPKSASGKILRKDLRAREAAKAWRPTGHDSVLTSTNDVAAESGCL